jgi:hypothetical protein
MITSTTYVAAAEDRAGLPVSERLGDLAHVTDISDQTLSRHRLRVQCRREDTQLLPLVGASVPGLPFVE